MLIMAVGSPFPWGFAIAMADGLTSLSKIGVVGGFYLTWNLIGGILNLPDLRQNPFNPFVNYQPAGVTTASNISTGVMP